MATDRKSLLHRYAEMWQRNYKASPSAFGQIAAMLREAVKDIRNTIHQFFFGRPEGMQEAGAPMVPTQQIVTGSLTGNSPMKVTMDEMRGIAARNHGWDNRPSRGNDGPPR